MAHRDTNSKGYHYVSFQGDISFLSILEKNLGRRRLMTTDKAQNDLSCGADYRIERFQEHFRCKL